MENIKQSEEITQYFKALEDAQMKPWFADVSKMSEEQRELEFKAYNYEWDEWEKDSFLGSVQGTYEFVTDCMKEGKTFLSPTNSFMLKHYKDIHNRLRDALTVSEEKTYSMSSESSILNSKLDTILNRIRDLEMLILKDYTRKPNKLSTEKMLLDANFDSLDAALNSFKNLSIVKQFDFVIVHRNSFSVFLNDWCGCRYGALNLIEKEYTDFYRLDEHDKLVKQIFKSSFDYDTVLDRLKHIARLRDEIQLSDDVEILLTPYGNIYGVPQDILDLFKEDLDLDRWCLSPSKTLEPTSLFNR